MFESANHSLFAKNLRQGSQFIIKSLIIWLRRDFIDVANDFPSSPKHSLDVSAVSTLKTTQKTSYVEAISNSGSCSEDAFTRVLGKSALSFAFSFLLRCWRSNLTEDRLVCHEMLKGCLEQFESIPIGSLFNLKARNKAEQSDVQGLLDMALRCNNFLDSILCG